MKFNDKITMSLLCATLSLSAAQMSRLRLSDLQIKVNQLIPKAQNEKVEKEICAILNEISTNPIARRPNVADWLTTAYKQLDEALRRPSICSRARPAEQPAAREISAVLPTQSTVPSAPPMPRPPVPAQPTEIPGSVKETLRPKPSSLPELVNYIDNVAQESEDVRQFAQKYKFVNPNGTVNAKEILADVTATEKEVKKAARSISPQKLEETEATVMPQLNRIRTNVERFQVEQAQVEAPQAPVNNDLQESLHYLASMVNDSNNIPAMAEKYGLVQNGVVDTDTLSDMLNTHEQAILDLAAQQSAAKRAEVAQIIAPQVETIRTNIANYRRAQVPQAPTLQAPEIPEAPELGEIPGLKPREAQAPAVKPKKPTQQPASERPAIPSAQEFQEAAAKLKPAQEKETAQELLAIIKQQNFSPAALKSGIEKMLSIAQQDDLIRIYIDNAEGLLYELPDQDKDILIALLSAKSDRVGPNAKIANQLAQLRYKGPVKAAEVQEHVEDWSTNDKEKES